ncbi:MAG: deoxyribose-phosphate aldolase [Bacilli bacterium]|nr:deoxyribose-phosphate aldolase [Bacilli bacterium]
MELNKYIEHTNLKANAKEEDIIKLCHEAMEYNFQAVVVNPHYITLAKDILKDTNIQVVTVIGFPLGANTTEVKVYEAIDAIEKGADEIDMVANIGAIKDKDFEYVKKEITDVFYSLDGKPLKVIIETCYLTDDEIKEMTKICNECFVNYIKTSTGFGTRGASIEDIDIINSVKSDILEVKASGGIRDYDTAINFINKGVTRIGTSNGVEIMRGDK